MAMGDFITKHFRTTPEIGLPTAPTSPNDDSKEAEDISSLSARLAATSIKRKRTDPNALTPPVSSAASASSATQTEGAEGTVESRRGSKRSSSGRQQPTTDGINPPNCRGGGLNPLSAATTTAPVTTPQLSSPSSRKSSAPCDPSADAASSQESSAQSALVSCLENVKLTDDVASPRLKTPPRTPRALSSDGSQGPRGSATAVATPRSNQSPARDPKNGSLPFRLPRGRLSVKISEARGLRPSHDPYAVCVFEWNESIARNEEADSKGGVEMEKDESRGRESSLGGVPIKRTASDMGRSIAIPMKSRQSSTTSLSDQKKFKNGNSQVTDPKWGHITMFDVLEKESTVEVYVYDRRYETFLGYVKVAPNVTDNNARMEGWYRLGVRNPEEDAVTGEIHLDFLFEKTDKKTYGPEDFTILRLVGKGTFGQVYQVRKKDTNRIYAMKVLSKKVIVQKKEVAHTIGERNILVRTAVANSPFIVGLKFSFQTPTDLYLVTGFMSGGELFWHLQKEGRFNESRSKFYIAELILALQHLHQYDIVYRDLKPENILLDANGHIALCDFGLSKANLSKDSTTNTFCGTTEYLAPEVLLDEAGYTTMVDFWSLGVLVFEMCCGWSPFYADDTQQMYKNIAFGKVRFPRDALSTEGRNFVKGLLNRNPKHRLGANRDAEELKEHPFFADTDWNAMMEKRVTPPFKPKLKNVLDTSNFDPEFTNALENSSSLNARAAQLAAGGVQDSTPLSPGMQANFKGFTFVDESTMDEQFRGHDNDLERMDEDDGEDAGEGDHDWDGETAAENGDGRGNRMSGILSGSGTDDGGSMVGHFDM